MKKLVLTNEVITREGKIEFKPQNTSIVRGVSQSAKNLVKDIKGFEKVLDYGCGSGRNMVYIKDHTNDIQVDGTDIIEQLEKEKNRHNELRCKGCIIVESNLLKSESYDKILNTHVLNVIESDEVKSLVVKDIYDKLKVGGTAYFEVRTKADIGTAKTKEKHGDGFKIKKGSDFTYQEPLTKEKMKYLLESNGFNIVSHIFNSSRHMVVVSK